MSCIHITSCQLACSPSAFTAKAFKLNTSPSSAYLGTRLPKISLKSTLSTSNSSSSSAYLGTRLPKISLKTIRAASNYQKSAVVCLFGGKGKSGNENQASPWNAIENAMGYFKKDRSVKDLWKQQIQKEEYYDGGDGGGKSPGGGGKSPGGGGDGFGEGGDEGLSGVWDEFVQVFLATMALIYIYDYILNGDQTTALAKDFLRFVFTRQKSLRLSRVLDQWNEFFEEMREKQVYEDPDWLATEIINTPTWYDHPDKYKLLLEDDENSDPDDEKSDDEKSDPDDEKSNPDDEKSDPDDEKSDPDDEKWDLDDEKSVERGLDPWDELFQTRNN